jgi:hypothetical protein
MNDHFQEPPEGWFPKLFRKYPTANGKSIFARRCMAWLPKQKRQCGARATEYSGFNFCKDHGPKRPEGFKSKKKGYDPEARSRKKPLGFQLEQIADLEFYDDLESAQEAERLNERLSCLRFFCADVLIKHRLEGLDRHIAGYQMVEQGYKLARRGDSYGYEMVDQGTKLLSSELEPIDVKALRDFLFEEAPIPCTLDGLVPTSAAVRLLAEVIRIGFKYIRHPIDRKNLLNDFSRYFQDRED